MCQRKWLPSVVAQIMPRSAKLLSLDEYLHGGMSMDSPPKHWMYQCFIACSDSCTVLRATFFVSLCACTIFPNKSLETGHFCLDVSAVLLIPGRIRSPLYNISLGPGRRPLL